MPVGGFGKVVDLLLDAFRHGQGIPYESYGEDFRGGQAGLNKPVFFQLLPGWIRTAMPDVHTRLSAGGAVADVACGAGWSSIALARAYPQARIDGYDSDPATIESARRNAREMDVADRVTFAVQDGGAPPWTVTMTWSASSTRCTTWPGPSRCWRPAGGSGRTAARSW
jgi:SAM-dependent methyltransferase